jgi:hypothetical protein
VPRASTKEQRIRKSIETEKPKKLNNITIKKTRNKKEAMLTYQIVFKN